MLGSNRKVSINSICEIIIFYLGIFVLNTFVNGQTQVKTLLEGVILTIDIEVLTSNKILVTGITNLPDDTEIIVGLKGGNIKFECQDKTKIKTGKYRFAPLGPSQGLIKAQYNVDVTMPYPFTQSPAVQKVIGNNGQNLKGPLVIKKQAGSIVKSKRIFKIN